MTQPSFESNMQVIEHVFAPVEGKALLDIGCGRGRLLRALIRRGARVSGVDPGAHMIARAAEMAPGATLHECGAEKLPFADGAFDGAVIMNALHHVPAELMAPALAEGLRVVRGGGPLLIIEPLAQGGYQEVFAPIDDETEIRAMALEAVAGFVAAGRARQTLDVTYETWLREESVESVLDAGLAVDPSRADRIAGVRDEVARRFEAHARPDAERGGYLLEQPMIAMVLTAAG